MKLEATLMGFSRLSARTEGAAPREPKYAVCQLWSKLFVDLNSSFDLENPTLAVQME